MPHNGFKQDLIEHMILHGAFDVKVADARVECEHFEEKRHPLTIWPQCRSVIVASVPMAARANNTYIGAIRPTPVDRKLGPVPGFIFDGRYAQIRISTLLQDHVAVHAIEFARSRGVELRKSDEVQCKVWACLSGLGVYGQLGVIVHPLLGTRHNLGVFLTNAELKPDPVLKDFSCPECGACIEACPGGAFEPGKPYPERFDPKQCRRTRAQLAEAETYCHTCWATCAQGSIDDESLLSIRRMRAYHEKETT